MEPMARRVQRIDGAALFSEISGVPALAGGWERCWRNQGAAGGDGQTLASFARGLGQRLADLHLAQPKKTGSVWTVCR